MFKSDVRGNRGKRADDGEMNAYEGVEESKRYGKRQGSPPAGTLSDSNEQKPVDKELPNYAPSGALAAEQNTYKGVVIKYSEPPEARKPKTKWRLYVFKGKDIVDTLLIHRQSAYLLGRDRIVADIPIDHPSCSKQHAALQYRQIVTPHPTDPTQTLREVKLYIIDLTSANGTFLNGERIDDSRYVELKIGDTIKFGFSTREYVVMNEDAVEDQEAP
ncbi:hypothetical protein HDU85_000555 [Gaertneriomyces sp. JEL0708]|nr:hypothetical protein HDU85_000555 [Gaertneriomyces sp. JEL0708]